MVVEGGAALRYHQWLSGSHGNNVDIRQLEKGVGDGRFDGAHGWLGKKTRVACWLAGNRV